MHVSFWMFVIFLCFYGMSLIVVHFKGWNEGHKEGLRKSEHFLKGKDRYIETLELQLKHLRDALNAKTQNDAIKKVREQNKK